MNSLLEVKYLVVSMPEENDHPVTAVEYKFNSKIVANFPKANH